jgi:hypothetical protein
MFYIFLITKLYNNNNQPFIPKQVRVCDYKIVHVIFFNMIQKRYFRHIDDVVGTTSCYLRQGNDSDLPVALPSTKSKNLPMAYNSDLPPEVWS